MQAVTLEVSIPKVLLSFGIGQEEIEREVKKWLVISLFRGGRISSGKAGSLLGITRRDFLDLLDREGIAYFDYSTEELEEEFKAVRKLKLVKEQP